LSLPEGVPASDNKVMLGIHVIDERRVGIPGLDETKIDRVQDIDIAIIRRSADVSAPFHNHVVILGWYLII
jgi:hypothetical protein